MHADELIRRGKNKATLPFKIMEMLAIQAFGIFKERI
jgi:hypothetical protein